MDDRPAEPHRDNGSEEEWTDPTPVHTAAERGKLARLQELLAGGHVVNAFDELGYTPLHYAVMQGHYEAAKILIQAGADVNAHDAARIGETPLGQISGNCSLRIAQLLVEAGADPTIPGWMQLTALHRAGQRKRGEGPQVYQLLLSAKRTGSGVRRSKNR